MYSSKQCYSAIKLDFMKTVSCRLQIIAGKGHRENNSEQCLFNLKYHSIASQKLPQGHQINIQYTLVY